MFLDTIFQQKIVKDIKFKFKWKLPTNPILDGTYTHEIKEKNEASKIFLNFFYQTKKDPDPHQKKIKTDPDAWIQICTKVPRICNTALNCGRHHIARIWFECAAGLWRAGWTTRGRGSPRGWTRGPPSSPSPPSSTRRRRTWVPMAVHSVVDPDPFGSVIINFGSGSDELHFLVTKIA